MYSATDRINPTQPLREFAVLRCVNQTEPLISVGGGLKYMVHSLDVARIVKELAERAKLDADSYAGHSLRAGHATPRKSLELRSGRS